MRKGLWGREWLSWWATLESSASQIDQMFGRDHLFWYPASSLLFTSPIISYESATIKIGVAICFNFVQILTKKHRRLSLLKRQKNTIIAWPTPLSTSIDINYKTTNGIKLRNLDCVNIRFSAMQRLHRAYPLHSCSWNPRGFYFVHALARWCHRKCKVC